MKKLLVVFLMITVAASVFSDEIFESKKYESDDYEIYKAEAAIILKSKDHVPMGEFTLKEIADLNLELSIPFQKMQYVKESKTASMIMPGMGQFMNDDPVGGTLFIISNIAVFTGSIMGAYYLLPDDLRFDRLDYFNDSIYIINDRWENHSIADMLPTIGTITAGFVVNGIIRLISATHAGKLAQKNIEEGSIQFEPKLMLPAFGTFGEQGSDQGGYGLGMNMSF